MLPLLLSLFVGGDLVSFCNKISVGVDFGSQFSLSAWLGFVNAMSRLSYKMQTCF